VRLNRIHPLAAGNPDADGWQPIDLNAEGTYSPDSIFFSNLVLGNGETTLAARVAATTRSLSLQNLKLLHGKSVWLTGDAQIPLNAWAAWQNPGATSWWNFESPCKLNLNLDHLSVHDTLMLSGRQQPFEGELTGSLKSDGTLAKLIADGHLIVKNAGGTLPAGILKGAGATLDFNAGQLTLTSGTGNWNGLAWSASGAIAASDLRAPSLDLAVQLPAATLALGNGMEGSASLDLHASGQPDALSLSGSAQLETLKINQNASMESLVAPGGTGLEGPFPAVTLAGPPAWTLAVQVGGNASVDLANASGKISPALEISGSLGQPVISGSVDVKGFAITEGPDSLALAGGTFILNPADPAASALALHATGVAGGRGFDGYIYGTLAAKQFTWDLDQTLALAGSAEFSTSAPMPAMETQRFSLDLGVQAAGLPVGPDAAPGFDSPLPDSNPLTP
jgi:autotransporter translocation and assembly factor TamB